jgi:hypothetical protein
LGACRLTLLGGFALESGDGKALALPTRKDRLLLAYLALSAGKPQTRDRLAGPRTPYHTAPTSQPATAAARTPR